MFLGGTIFSLLAVFIFTKQGFLSIDFVDNFPKIILINVIATIVESLPLQDWDNITVPGIVVLLSLILI